MEHSDYSKTKYNKVKIINIYTTGKASNIKVFVNGLRLCHEVDYTLNILDTVFYVNLKGRELDAGTALVVDYTLL